MVIFKIRKGIGKLKNISYYELQTIINSLPIGWKYDIVCTNPGATRYDSGIDKKYSRYTIKIYRED